MNATRFTAAAAAQLRAEIQRSGGIEVFAVGAIDAAAIATVRTLECSTESPVVATLAAVWGPDIRPIARKTIGHLRSRRVALALHAQLKGYPDIAALLDTVIRAMANR